MEELTDPLLIIIEYLNIRDFYCLIWTCKKIYNRDIYDKKMLNMYLQYGDGVEVENVIYNMIIKDTADKKTKDTLIDINTADEKTKDEMKNSMDEMKDSINEKANIMLNFMLRHTGSNMESTIFKYAVDNDIEPLIALCVRKGFTTWDAHIIPIGEYCDFIYAQKQRYTPKEERKVINITGSGGVAMGYNSISECHCLIFGNKCDTIGHKKNCIVLGSEATGYMDGQLVLGSARHPLDIIEREDGDYIHVVINGRRGRIPIIWDD